MSTVLILALGACSDDEGDTEAATTSAAAAATSAADTATSAATSAAAAATSAAAAATSAAAPAATGEKVALDWHFWAGSEAEVAGWQPVADMVAKQDPNLSTKINTAPWPDYWTKLPSLVDSNNAPCIIGMQMAKLQGFKETMIPLDDLLAGAGVNVADFDESIIKALSADGKLYALPYDLGPWIVFYNKDRFKEMNVPEPKNGWTTDEFIETAKKLTKGNNYGFAANNYVDTVNVWGPTIGGNQAAGDSKALLDSEGTQKTLDWYADLVRKHKVAAPIPATDFPGDGAAFLAGNSAMFVTGPWDMINIKATAKFEPGVVQLPVGPGGAKTVSGGSGFGISKNCKTPEAAMKAIAILTGPEAQEHVGNIGRGYPARKAQQETWYKNAVPGAKEVLEPAAANAEPFQSTPEWNDVNVQWSQGVVPVINGQAESKAFLEDLQSQFG